MMLRVALLAAAAGVASFTYLVRRRRPSHLARELAVAELDGQLRTWLPRLAYLGYVRLTVNGWPLLRLTAEPSRVRMQLLDPDGARRAAFRRTVDALGWPVVEPDGHSLLCELPLDADAVGRAVGTVLREVFDLDEHDRLSAEVPGDPARAGAAS